MRKQTGIGIMSPYPLNWSETLTPTTSSLRTLAFHNSSSRGGTNSGLIKHLSGIRIYDEAKLMASYEKQTRRSFGIASLIPR